METNSSSAPSTQKVRREQLGSKRAPGWEWQRASRRVRRANAAAVRIGKADATLSGVGGLASFNAFVQREGIGKTLRQKFGHLKVGKRVVYPLHTQIQLLLDASVVGARRVFDFEYLAADPLFTHLAGGAVPSVDTVYDDLRRFDAAASNDLEDLMAEQGVRPLRDKPLRDVTIDIDTTVTPLFGTQEGAVPGPNPRYPGRPSYHPILGRIAEVDTVIGARLRPGDTGLGSSDVEDIEDWINRTHRAAPKAIITVRIDAGGDCTALLSAIERRKGYFLVKMKQTSNLVSAVCNTKRWTTIDVDASNAPTRQVAEIDFRRDDWPKERRWRVFAVRTTERESGKQVCLWPDLDFSVHVYVTNDMTRNLDELARLYDDRAAIEPLIAELKNAFGIGKVSTSDFAANEAAFLIKLLAYNVMRRWVMGAYKSIACWRASWIRRAVLCVPARLLRTNGHWDLRLAPRPLLN